MVIFQRSYGYFYIWISSSKHFTCMFIIQIGYNLLIYLYIVYMCMKTLQNIEQLCFLVHQEAHSAKMKSHSTGKKKVIFAMAKNTAQGKIEFCLITF